MREKYWYMFHKRQYQYEFINEYNKRSNSWNIGITIFLAITSSSGIAGWSIWNNNPIWAIIIMASQVVALLKDVFPWTKRINAAKHCLSELSPLLNRIDRDWSRIDIESLNDTEINDMIFQYDEEYRLIDEKYIDSALFPGNRRIINHCTEISSKIMEQKFGKGDSKK